MQDFLDGAAQLNIDVSRETLDKLEAYRALLLKWQRAVNLISPTTLNEAWVRHFLDSAQLAPFIPQDVVIADMGCGAGFPGLVLKIMRPDIELHCIESDNKKCQFLKTVSRETGADIHVHNARIEDVEITPEYATARALADLSQLLEWTLYLGAGGAVFLKGAQWEQEVSAAQSAFDFDYKFHASITGEDAQILEITNIARCG